MITTVKHVSFLILTIYLLLSTSDARILNPFMYKNTLTSTEGDFECRSASKFLPLVTIQALPSISPQTGSVFISSFLTAAVLYPLDLLRGLKMQSPGVATGTLVSKFIKDFGPLGVFKQGIVPEVSRATVMRGVKFALYPQVHEKVRGRL